MRFCFLRFTSVILKELSFNSETIRPASSSSGIVIFRPFLWISSASKGPPRAPESVAVMDQYSFG